MANKRFGVVPAAVVLSLAAFLVETRKLHLVVRVPPNTPAEAQIFLGCAHDGWKPNGLRLTRQSDGTFTGEIEIEIGRNLEFKITRGSWETVEKLTDGGERENRSVKVEATTKQIDVVVERWASGPEIRASTVVGTLKLHTIDSTALKQPRIIRVWLPPGYRDSTRKYDVLYMHDGQNCFDRATSAFGQEWEIDEALTRLIDQKRIEPLIVVGIDNGGTERIGEYTYVADKEHRGGRAEIHARFLLDEVQPLVNENYRTQTGKPHTFVGGSSLGGLISLELARRHPDRFGGVIAMSPALWWADDALTVALERDASSLAHTRIWIDVGTREGQNDDHSRWVDSVRRVGAAFEKQKIEHRVLIDDGAIHNEGAWAKRFPAAIQYVLGGN